MPRRPAQHKRRQTSASRRLGCRDIRNHFSAGDQLLQYAINSRFFHVGAYFHGVTPRRSHFTLKAQRRADCSGRDEDAFSFLFSSH